MDMTRKLAERQRKGIEVDELERQEAIFTAQRQQDMLTLGEMRRREAEEWARSHSGDVDTYEEYAWSRVDADPYNDEPGYDANPYNDQMER